MESLSLDIVLEILSRVPPESVLECKFVCKIWETLIRGSKFANMHLSHQLNHLHDGDDDNDKMEQCLFFACLIGHSGDYTTLLFHGGQVSDRIALGEKYIYNQNLKRNYHPPMLDEILYNHLVGSCNGLVCAFQYHHLVVDPIYICNPLTREYVYLPQLVIKEEDFDPEITSIACGFGYVRSTNEYKVIRIYYLSCTEGNVEVYALGSGHGWRAIGKVSYGLLGSLSTGKGTYANDVICWISYNKVVAFDLADEEFRLLSAPPCMQNRKSGIDVDL